MINSLAFGQNNQKNSSPSVPGLPLLPTPIIVYIQGVPKKMGLAIFKLLMVTNQLPALQF